MNKITKFCLLCISILTLCFVLNIPAEAGEKKFDSDLFTVDGELNNAEWNNTDPSVVLQNGKLVIPAETSTADTKFISKNVAVAHEALAKVVEANGSLRITKLPGNEKFIIGLGFGSIEASTEETGNIEIAFTNNGGICVSVTTYNDEGATTIVSNKKCNLSLNQQFEFEAFVSGKQVLTVKINGATICEQKINVDGSGRFGIVQTGSCGAVISKLHISCSQYDAAANTNIEEDFEDNEWNANELNAQLFGTNGAGIGSMQIEEFNGSKVLRIRNAGLPTAGKIASYISTMHPYSNFEISFDVPYFQREKIMNEEGEQIGKPCTGIYLAFGMELTRYNTTYETNKYNTEALIIGPSEVSSHVFNTDLKVDLEEFQLFKPGSNEGFSVKFTMLDGIGTLQMKSLNGNEWKTILTEDYSTVFRDGYVALWTVASGDYALDNLKILNRDVAPNLIDVEYKSSIIKVEDYVPTEEDSKMEFRPDSAENANADKNAKDNKLLPVIVLSVVSVTLAGGAILIAVLVKKQKKQKGGKVSEEE